MFTPEFRNRLDAVVSFGNLPKEVIAQVVDKFVAQLEAQLADRHVTISLSDEARDWLVEHGYDQTMGARPMGRLIQSSIKTGLAEEVLFGKLKGGGNVRVIVVEDEGRKKLGFEFPEGPVQPKPEKVPVKAKAKPKVRPPAEKKAVSPNAAQPKAAPPALPLPPEVEPRDDGGKPRRSPVPKLPLKK